MYAPLEEARALFREFADLQADDRNAILRFANKYGLLGIPRFHDQDIERDGKKLMRVGCETWKEWKQNIVEMRRAVEVWNRWRAGDVEGLSKSIRLETVLEPPGDQRQGERQRSVTGLG
jgi:hypothetical protein